MAGRRCCPIQPRGSSPPDRTAPSCVVDPSLFAWTDDAWSGRRLVEQVLYELHVGTFTPEGTWAAAMRELPALAALGVTTLEVMPVAEFPGRFGWGYDGVDLYAPTRLYGAPDDFRRFVDQAHRCGLGVILDVVYNHLRARRLLPARVLARRASPIATTTSGATHSTSTAPTPRPVREFFIANAGYWIDEFHLDGLRLDATQSIHDASPEHVLAAMARRARQAAGRRTIVLIAENEPQDVAPAARPGLGAATASTALWNDDFHHSARVALTGRREAYYTDYGGTAAGARRGGQVGLPLPGPALRLAEAAARHADLRHRSPRASSPICRTTTRSPTPPPARDCTR